MYNERKLKAFVLFVKCDKQIVPHCQLTKKCVKITTVSQKKYLYCTAMTTNHPSVKGKKDQPFHDVRVRLEGIEDSDKYDELEKTIEKLGGKVAEFAINKSDDDQALKNFSNTVTHLVVEGTSIKIALIDN